MKTLPMNTPHDEPQPEPRERQRPTAAIRDGILVSLGRPPALYRVTVVPLWSNCYRVNVLVGVDPTAVGIAHSYFVTADEIGRVLASIPPLVRLYP